MKANSLYTFFLSQPSQPSHASASTVAAGGARLSAGRFPGASLDGFQRAPSLRARKARCAPVRWLPIGRHHCGFALACIPANVPLAPLPAFPLTPLAIGKACHWHPFPTGALSLRSPSRNRLHARPVHGCKERLRMYETRLRHVSSTRNHLGWGHAPNTPATPGYRAASRRGSLRCLRHTREY